MGEVVRATCPGCRKLLSIPAEWVGQQMRCKHCGLTVEARPRLPNSPLPPTAPCGVWWKAALAALCLVPVLATAAVFGAMELFGLLFLLPLVLHHAFAWLVERGHARPLAPAHRAVLAACMVYAIATLYTSSSEFIYFQF